MRKFAQLCGTLPYELRNQSVTSISMLPGARFEPEVRHLTRRYANFDFRHEPRDILTKTRDRRRAQSYTWHGLRWNGEVRRALRPTCSATRWPWEFRKSCVAWWHRQGLFKVDLDD